METLRMYAKLVGISMRSRMQYRADLITGILGVIILNTVNLALIGILVTRFTSLNGWTLWDMIFLYSMWMLCHSIYSMFFWHIGLIEDHIVRGTFDQFLIRPLSPLVQFLGREINYMGIGDAMVGVAGLTIAYINLGLHWEVWQWFYLCIAVIAGTIIEAAIAWIIGCLSFWTVRSSSTFTIWYRINSLVQQYPIDIFGSWFKIVVTGFVPVAFLNYYPSLLLLGKEQVSFSSLGMYSPIVALLMLVFGGFFWTKSICHYGSTGN